MLKEDRQLRRNFTLIFGFGCFCAIDIRCYSCGLVSYELGKCFSLYMVMWECLQAGRKMGRFTPYIWEFEIYPGMEGKYYIR